MTFQTFAFVAFTLFAAIVVAQKQPAIDEDTIFATTMGSLWDKARIAVNNQGKIEIWTPNDASYQIWTMQPRTFSADRSSPIDIAPHGGEWIGFVIWTLPQQVKFAGTPFSDAVLFTQTQSISLTLSANMMVVGGIGKVSVFNKVFDEKPHWKRYNVPFKQLPGAKKVFVKADRGTFAMTQFAHEAAQTDVFRQDDDGNWIQVCQSIHHTYPSSTLPKIGQSVLSFIFPTLVVSYPDETSLYLLVDTHVNCKWNEVASISGGHSNSMNDGNLLLIGFEEGNTTLFDIQWGYPVTTTTQVVQLPARNSWILTFLTSELVVVNGEYNGIWNISNLQLSSTDGRTSKKSSDDNNNSSNADLIVIAALFMIAALMKALRR